MNETEAELDSSQDTNKQERIMKSFLTIIYFIFIPLTLYGIDDSQLVFQHINTNNGLKHNSVLDITQDYREFIWIATENGLHRFDGVDMNIYMHNKEDSSSISGNVIYGVYEDKAKNLWIATNSGLNLYNREEDNFLRIGLVEDLKNEKRIIYDYYVPAIDESREGNIYISWGNHGIWKLDRSRNILLPQPIRDKEGQSFILGNITEIFVDSDNLLWMGSKSEGLFLYYPEKSFTKNFRSKAVESVSSDFIYSINEDKYGRIFIGNEAGLDIYDKATETFQKYSNLKKDSASSLGSNWVWNIDKDNEGDLWFCSNRTGLFKMINKEIDLIGYTFDERNPASLNDNNIQCFLEDNQGNYWIGTQRGGLNYALNNNSQVFKVISRNPIHTTTLSHNRVTSIFEKTDSLLFIGTDGGGLNIYDRKTNRFLSLHKSEYHIKPKEDAVLTLHLDKNENLWTGGFLTGLNLYQPNKEKQTWKNNPNDTTSLANNDVRDIFEDSDKNLWIATNGGGLNIFNPNDGNFRRLMFHPSRESISSNFTLTIKKGPDDFLWLGTYEGLDRINPKNLNIKNYSGEHNLTGEWIYSLLVDSKKQLWVGTNMAIHRYDKGNDTFINFTDSIDLPNEIVSGILEDDQGNLWISTSNGLARYNPNNKTTNLYFHYDGLPSNFFNPGAIFKNSDGLLFFGTSEGLVYFDPSEITTNREKPPVYITDVAYAQETSQKHHINSGDTLKINYKEAASVNFYFCALNYINSQKNSYAFQLTGIDNQWKHVQNQKFAIYTNLSPGEYKFKVKASNNDNYWNNEGDYIHVIVTPPFWKTNFAYVLYSLAIITLLTFILRYSFIRARYADKLKIQRIKAEKAEEMANLKTDFFINISHELSTPLTLILAPVEKLIKNNSADPRLLQIIRRNALGLKRLVSEIIDSQRLEEKNNKKEYKYSDIVRFIKRITEEFSELATSQNISLQFSSDLSSFVFPFATEDLEKITNNLISNAIKYNNPNGKVDVSLSFIEPDPAEKGKTFCLKVSDTGPGIDQSSVEKIFDRYYRADESKSTDDIPQKTGFGIGLYLTKKLIELHHGHVEVESSPGKGSTFTVFLPYIAISDATPALNKTGNDTESAQEYISPQSEFKADHKPNRSKHSILIAEDNMELSNLLNILLSDDYRLSFATNGKEALDKIGKHIPDLVITDIMMPEMDGIELCKHLKKELSTSHIPVVMLTALNSGEMMVKGLTSGADDYVAKPFNPDVLQARVKNLIDSRLNLQKKYLTDLKTQPSELAISSADDLFLEKLHKTIEQNMEDPEFQATNIASEMNMSNITLYRKIKSLTGQSINPFIRTIRLKKAAILLNSNTMSIPEVAFQVGFNDVKYFRKCFYKHFRKKPSDFNKSNPIEN
jgi:signal transduction histidine kinase/DNA-binding response OmpR family regulator/streptogramin lyase